MERKRTEPLFIGAGGKGMIVAVPTPIIHNSTTSDRWIPQFIQDLITGDLARFSAMTVLDRRNEQLTITEQQLSESGFYSDDNFIAIGNMTNAQYLVAGNIQNMSGSYIITFRINDITTNEIQSAFSQRYSLREIESGKAAKEVVRELLTGMGIELTSTGERLLFDEQDSQVNIQAIQNLSRGMAAEKSNNIVDALAFFSGSLDSNYTKEESTRHIQSFFIDIQTDSIRERANYVLTQKAKWEKIFSDLKIYIRNNLPIFIYDFSVIEDKIDVRSKEVTIYVSPGIKVIPNRTVLLVYKTIMDNWFRIRSIEENKEWVKDVRLPGGTLSTQPSSYDLSFTYSAEIGLFDDYGDKIANFRWYGSPPKLNYNYLADHGARINPSFQVLSQHKYYNDTNFDKIVCTVPHDKITNTITPKIERVYYSTTDNAGKKVIHNIYPAFSAMEWQELLISDEGIRNWQ
jgi:TolB-like protein